MMNLILALDGALGIITIILLVKELLIKYNFSKKGFKNFIFIFCGILTAVIANASLFYGYTATQYKASIEVSLQKDNSNVLHDGVPEEQILKDQLMSANKMISQVEIYTAIGYALFVVTFAINKNIKNEKNTNVSTGKWDLKKFK